MFHNFLHFYAGVLELADEADSKSAACEGVWVRVPPPAPKVKEWIDTIKYQSIFFCKKDEFLYPQKHKITVRNRQSLFLKPFLLFSL